MKLHVFVHRYQTHFDFEFTWIDCYGDDGTVLEMYKNWIDEDERIFCCWIEYIPQDKFEDNDGTGGDIRVRVKLMSYRVPPSTLPQALLWSDQPTAPEIYLHKYTNMQIHKYTNTSTLPQALFWSDQPTAPNI